MNISATIEAGEPLNAGVPTMAVLLERGRALVPLLKERAEQTERDRRVSADAMTVIKEQQLHRLMQPKRFGGFEYGFRELVQMNFEMAQGCGSTAWCLCLAAVHNWLLALFPLEAQEEVWRDPDVMISGSYMPVGRCQPADGGYWLSGAWSFSSNCDNSAWYIVGAMVPPESGEGRPTPTWFILSQAQARIQDTWFSAGLAGTGSKTVVVDEPVFVPAYRALAVPVINSGNAPGAQVSSNPLYRLTFTGAAPFALCSLPVGMAMGAIEDFVALARVKTVPSMSGPPMPMVGYPYVQQGLAEAAAAVDAAATLLLRDTAEIGAGLAEGALPSVSQRIKYRRNHAYSGKLAAQASTVLFEMTGASGGALSNPVQRAWRDINVAVRHISLSWPTVSAMYGQYALGLPPEGTY
jgi:alkylation response protein AidB-like acyl-CoA dehydrogenase